MINATGSFFYVISAIMKLIFIKNRTANSEAEGEVEDNTYDS